MTELAELPLPPPLFFLSYARDGSGAARVPKHELHSYAPKFFEDLSENVAGLTARRPGADPGFMDRTILTGTQWPLELLRALGTCQTFVALLGGPYISSEWCGMEWDGFSRRTAAEGGGPGKPSPIVPVIWRPYPGNRMPKVIRDAQWFSPGTAPKTDLVGPYEEYGIAGLLWTNQDDVYRFIVWRLAKHIADFCHGHHVMEQVLRMEDLRNTFQGS
jgi:hypothetical protein